MIIIKFDETLINLSTKEIFSNPNTNEVIMDKLRARFEGKCEKNVLIIKILAIIKRSRIMMCQNVLDGSGNVNVQFKSEALVYNKGDILIGCKVIKIERAGKIMCTHDNAVVIIEGNKTLQSLKIGQTMPVIVENSSYQHGKDKITIYGMPYSYNFEFTIYSLTAVNQEENLELIARKLVQIDEEVKLYAGNKKRIDYFNDIFYPFKIEWETYKKKNELGKIVIKDLLTLAKNIQVGKSKDIAIFKHPVINKSDTEIFTIDVKDLTNLKSDLLNTDLYRIKMVEEDASVVMLKLLADHLNHIRGMREMAELFKTDASLESHANIWNIYQKIKR